MWICYVYAFILYMHIPKHMFYKQSSSFNTNLSFGFFYFLSQSEVHTVQCMLEVKADSVCLFTTWCLLMLFYL